MALPPEKKPSLLVLDDSRDVVDVVHFILHETCAVCGALNLDDARALMKETAFELFLLDFYLEDKSIFEFMAELVKTVSPKRVAVMSGHFGDGMSLRIRAYGISEFLEKPFSPDELRRMIRRMVHQLPQQPPPDEASSPTNCPT